MLPSAAEALQILVVIRLCRHFQVILLKWWAEILFA